MELRKNVVDNLEISVKSSINLNLQTPGSQINVNQILISIFPQENEKDVIIIVNDGWESVTNLNNIKIEASEHSNAIVASPIYPVPSLNINKEYSTMFYPLSKNPHTSDSKRISNDLTLKIAEDTNSHYVVNGNSLIVSNSATVKCDFNATIQLNSLNIIEDSSPQLREFSIKNNANIGPGTQTSTIDTAFLPNSVLEIHWSKDKWSFTLLSLNNIASIPDKLLIILDDKYLNYEEYYNYTYR